MPFLAPDRQYHREAGGGVQLPGLPWPVGDDRDPPTQRRAGEPPRPSRECSSGTQTGHGLLGNPYLSEALNCGETSAPNGIRTRAAALKGRCPRPLDDGGACALTAVTA
jgi:hypothetical protein